MQQCLNHSIVLMYHSQECNQYLAGHALSSKGRYKALDETALAGVVCRQQFLLKFFSLCHGERLEEVFLNLNCVLMTSCRLSYIVFALEQIKDVCSKKKMYILYDIACLLKKHFTGTRES